MTSDPTQRLRAAIDDAIDWLDHGDPYAAEHALRAALSTTPAPLDYGWHGDGDLCLGRECLNTDENTGDHDTDVHSDEWWDGFTEAGRRIAALSTTPAPDVPERVKVPQPDPTTPLGWALLMVGSFTVKDDSGNLCTMILGERDNVARRMEAWLAQHPKQTASLEGAPRDQ